MRIIYRFIHRFTVAFLIVVIYLYNVSFASNAALDPISGYRLMQACQNHLDDRNQTDPHNQGICLGIIMGVTDTSENICLPKEVNYYKIISHLMNYLDKHPERLHERLSYLARDAFTSAYPCNHSQ